MNTRQFNQTFKEELVTEAIRIETLLSKKRSLLQRLAQTGVKHNPDAIIVLREINGQIIFLERGNQNAGYHHLHINDFKKKGVSPRQLPETLFAVLSHGSIVGYQNKKRGNGRPIYAFTLFGQRLLAAITISSNGFMVGANPR